MRLAALKRDFIFRRPTGDSTIVLKGTVVQTGAAPFGGVYHLSAPGGLFSLVDNRMIDNIVEFLGDETSKA